MSIDIDWESLTTGPSGLQLAESIRDFIHDRFQQATLPRFIRSVHVHSFDFGKECPTVELKDISDPLPEFYEDSEESDNDDGDCGEGDEEDGGPGDLRTANQGSFQSGQHLQGNPHTQSYCNSDTSVTAKPAYINTHLPTLRSGFVGFSDQLASPFLSRSSTPAPGIPGGTSNFSYFHLPLSATGLSGPGTGTHTPLAAAVGTPLFTPQQQWGGGDQRQPYQHDPQNYKHLQNQPSTGSNAAPLQQQLSSTNFSPSSPSQANRSQDLQTTLHITYTGHPTLSLTAEILLDYPMPSFVGIPLKLQITGLSFDGVALVAYLVQQQSQKNGQEETGDEAKKRKVCFCFLEGDEDKDTDAHAHAILPPSSAPNNTHSDNITTPKPTSAKSGGEVGTLFRSIRVESEIGRQEQGKPVLKNVGKVERFVLEQVRRIFQEELVWPSFWTFLV